MTLRLCVFIKINEPWHLRRKHYNACTADKNVFKRGHNFSECHQINITGVSFYLIIPYQRNVASNFDYGRTLMGKKRIEKGRVTNVRSPAPNGFNQGDRVLIFNLRH